MQARPMVVITVFVVAIVAGAALPPWLRAALAVAAAAGTATVLATRCGHRHATLLPAVHGAGPDRDHARWYCDRCGRTWPAGFATDTRPRLIFDGYDEHKAVRAAARADALEKERRRLATKRAGWTPAQGERVAASTRSGSRTLEAVPFRRARE